MYHASFNPLYHTIKGLSAAVSDWQTTDALCLSITRFFSEKHEPTFLNLGISHRNSDFWFSEKLGRFSTWNPHLYTATFGMH